MPLTTAGEETTARDGLLSHAVEVHALLIGALVGYADARNRPLVAWLALVTARSAKGRAEIRAEPWYAIGGYLGGRLTARHIHHLRS
jgi:hypothetical protein